MVNLQKNECAQEQLKELFSCVYFCPVLLHTFSEAGKGLKLSDLILI
jgi:hypothetical protein